jgi:hypothetical protein
MPIERGTLDTTQLHGKTTGAAGASALAAAVTSGAAGRVGA